MRSDKCEMAELLFKILVNKKKHRLDNYFIYIIYSDYYFILKHLFIKRMRNEKSLKYY